MNIDKNVKSSLLDDCKKRIQRLKVESEKLKTMSRVENIAHIRRCIERIDLDNNGNKTPVGALDCK